MESMIVKLTKDIDLKIDSSFAMSIRCNTGIGAGAITLQRTIQCQIGSIGNDTSEFIKK